MEEIKDDNLHKGHRKRLREELFSNDFKGFSDHKVLEYILFNTNRQLDCNPLAHRLIQRFGSLNGVLEARVEELLKVKGVGETTAYMLSSYLKIMDVYKQNAFEKKVKLVTTKDYVETYSKMLREEREEIILITLLNGKYEVIKTLKLAKGNYFEVGTNKNDFIQLIFKFSPSYLVLMHNHPSNNCNPSPNDIAFTRKIIEQLKILDCEILDHIIISKDCYYSFKEHNEL